MSFGYIGDTSTSVKQQVKNKGILTTQESFDLERQGFLGGSLELIVQQSHSSDVGIVDFTSIKEDVYDVHLLQFFDLATDGTSSNIRLQLYENGVLETASVYQRARQFGDTSGTFTEDNTTSTDAMTICNYKGSVRTGNGYIYLYNLGNSSKYSFATFQTLGGHTTDQINFGGAILSQASKVDGIRILGGSGTTNMTDYNLKLYGVKQI
jgi:hypothetical protein